MALLVQTPKARHSRRTSVDCLSIGYSRAVSLLLCFRPAEGIPSVGPGVTVAFRVVEELVPIAKGVVAGMLPPGQPQAGMRSWLAASRWRQERTPVRRP